MSFTTYARQQSRRRAGRGLGLTSLAIGLTELFFPHKIEQTMGVSDSQNTGILRVLGVRELAHGFDLLTHDNPNPGIVARAVGDLLDSAVLAAAAKKTRNPKGLLTILALVTPVVLADFLLAPRR